MKSAVLSHSRTANSDSSFRQHAADHPSAQSYYVTAVAHICAVDPENVSVSAHPCAVHQTLPACYDGQRRSAADHNGADCRNGSRIGYGDGRPEGTSFRRDDAERRAQHDLGWLKNNPTIKHRICSYRNSKII